MRPPARLGEWLLATAVLFGLSTGHAQSQSQPKSSAQSQSAIGPLSPVVGMCGSLQNHFGPFDYRTAPYKDRHIVERFHFTTSVETLKRGNTGTIGGDLNYTLRVFPNHARALAAMSRYAMRLGTTAVPGAEYPAECYFDRAIRFAPDDAQVRALYADFLIHFKRRKDARDQLEAAERLNPTSPQVLYNLGLAWNALGENDKALPLARRAYEGGVPFPALRDKLKAAGAWRD